MVNPLNGVQITLNGRHYLFADSHYEQANPSHSLTDSYEVQYGYHVL
jgi:hypothetical protein